MKKIVVILLCLLCLLWAGSALAEKPLVARSGGLAAYYDGAGGIAIPGKSGVINANTAAGIVAVQHQEDHIVLHRRRNFQLSPLLPARYSREEMDFVLALLYGVSTDRLCAEQISSLMRRRFSMLLLFS